MIEISFELTLAYTVVVLQKHPNSISCFYILKQA